MANENRIFSGWRAKLAVTASRSIERVTRSTARMGKPDFLQPAAVQSRCKLTFELQDNRKTVTAENQQGSRLRCLVGQTLVFLGAGNERFRNGRNNGMLDWHDRPFKRNLQHFIHGLYKFYCETGEDFLRYLR